VKTEFRSWVLEGFESILKAGRGGVMRERSWHRVSSSSYLEGGGGGKEGGREELRRGWRVWKGGDEIK
jgi:hypothetical protein